MNEIFVNVIVTLVTTVLLPLLTLLGTKVVQLVNKKIGNEKVARYMTELTNLVFNVVQETTQTYVDDLKKEGKFDKEHQKEALKKSLEKIKSEMSAELKEYVAKVYGDVEPYLTTLIEATIRGTK